MQGMPGINKIKKKADNAAYYAANKKAIAASRKVQRAENKDEIAAYAKKWYAANKEVVLARAKTWGDSNLETRSARSKIYNAGAGREKNRARSAAWRKANPEKFNAQWKDRHKAHPEIRRRNKQLRRAREHRAETGDANIITKWEKSWRSKASVICYWCSSKASPKACHSDHVVPLSKGGAHEIGNLCISCATCNHKKGSIDLRIWNSRINQPVLL